MALTLQQLIDEVKYRVFPNISDSSQDTAVQRRLQWAYRDLNQQLVIPELETTGTITLVTSQRQYNLPADILTIMSLRNYTRRRPIVPLTTSEEAAIDETETGEPTHYYREGYTLILYPMPSSTFAGDTLRLRYLKLLTALDFSSPTSTTSSLPDYCDELLVLGASHKLHRDQTEPELASLAFRDYRAKLKEVNNFRKEEFGFQSGTTRVIR